MSNLPRKADVAIIGGGIMGLSTAYYLKKEGVANIVLFEQNLLAQASTGLSVGGIRQQFSHPANILLSQRSLKIFSRFSSEFDVDIRFRRAGYLFLTGKEATWKEFLLGVEIQKEYNVPVETLRTDQISSRWPYLRVDDLKGGTYCAEDGYADPYLTAMGFAARAREMGVTIKEKSPVQEILFAGNCIKGVRSGRETISCPIVVNAAGPWAEAVGRMAGLSLPVKPYRRQVFMTGEWDRFPPPVPMIIDMDKRFYFRGEPPGLIVGMSDPQEPSSFKTHTDRDFMERVVEQAVHRAPSFESASILRGWGGLYAVTPDENPIIGALEEKPGLFCAVGFSGHGFQHGPAVGQILARLITGKDEKFDLSPFSLKRFQGALRKREHHAV